MIVLGIDLGGRTTGKTAVTIINDVKRECRVYPAAEISGITVKSDENFISWINSQEFDIAGIDAPLSLPDLNSPDYLFRPEDRLAGAMSPMRLGELTARAIYISSKLIKPVVEVYPKSMLKYLGLPAIKYKEDKDLLAAIVHKLSSLYELPIPKFELTGDNVDSLLAAAVLLHYSSGKYKNIGKSVPFIIPV